MAITFPRELPFMPNVESTFELDPGTAVARHARGLAGTTSRVREPLWTVRFATEPLTIADKAAWQAWYNSLGGGLKLFLGWDVTRHQPLAYPNGVPTIIAGTWDGTASVTSLATPGQIAVTGAPAAFALRPGDRVGLVESGRYGFFEVAEAATANGSGAMAIPIQPLVQPLFTAAATAVLHRPRCKMMVMAGTFSCPGVGGLAPVSFQASQVL